MTPNSSAGPSPAESERAPALIAARDVTVGYEVSRGRSRLTALRQVSLEVHKGEFVAIVGPSGCGKTTFISLVAGFLHPWEGTVTVRGEPVRGPAPDRAMVFQDYALMP